MLLVFNRRVLIPASAKVARRSSTGFKLTSKINLELKMKIKLSDFLYLFPKQSAERFGTAALPFHYFRFSHL